MLRCSNVFCAYTVYFLTCVLFLNDDLYCRTTFIILIIIFRHSSQWPYLRNHDYKCAMHYWVNEGQNATPPPQFSTRRNLDSSSPGARVIITQASCAINDNTTRDIIIYAFFKYHS